MSVAYKFKSQIPSIFPVATAPEALQASAYRPQTAEAPDRGYSGEAREGRSPEAPDAGEGRASYCEHEYTHGRSQS